MLGHKKGDRAGIQSVEIWAYRRLLRISWSEKRSNESVLEEIGEFKGLFHQLGHGISNLLGI